jgi:hypothetical protein
MLSFTGTKSLVISSFKMNDPFSIKLEEIRKEAEGGGTRIFYGHLAEDSNVPTVHWNQENGGDWKKFLACAKVLSPNILYVNWAPFEQFEIDDAISKLESKITEDEEEDKETNKLLSQVRAFQPKVGITCFIELVFIADGVVHIYEECADWFDEFGDLTNENEDEDDQLQKTKPISKAVMDKWATALASDPQYPISKQREHLLEMITGSEFAAIKRTQIFEILRRAETIYQTQFKQAAEIKLANEIQELRKQGLNIVAIALKLGISRNLVSALVSGLPKK